MKYINRAKKRAISLAISLAAMFLYSITECAASQDPPRATPEVRAQLDSANKALYAKPPRYDEAATLAEKALVRSREISDRQGEVDAIRLKGNVHAVQGRSDEAVLLYKESQSLAESQKDEYGQAVALFCLGSTYESKNDWRAAEKAHERALEFSDVSIKTLKSDLLAHRFDCCFRGCQQLVHDRRLSDAQAAFKRAELSLAALGPGHPYETVKCRIVWTRILELQGKAAEADIAYHDLAERFDNDKERISAALEFFNCGYELVSIGYVTRAVPAYQAAIRLFTKARNVGHSEMAQNNLANAYITTGAVNRGLVIHQQLLNAHRGRGDRAGEALSLTNIAFARQRLGQYAEALLREQEAAAIYRELKQWYGESKALGQTGWCELQVQRVPEARKHLEAALSLENGQNPELHAEILSNLAEVDLRQGDMLAALAKLYQAMETHRARGALAEEAEAMRSIGAVFRNIGRLRSAEAWYLSALRSSLARHDRPQEARARAHLGLLYGDLGLLRQAAEQHRLAMQLSKTLGDRDTEAAEMNNLGLVYKRLDDYPRAAQLFNAALSLSIRIGNKNWETIQTHNVGTIFERNGQNARALDYYKRAFTLAIACYDTTEAVLSLTDLALIEGLLHRTGDSARHYREAAQMAECLSRNFESSTDARMAFQERYQNVFGGCVDSLLATGNVTEAFAWAQKMKGRALLNLMAGRLEVNSSITLQERKELDDQNAREARINLSMISEGVINAPGSKKRYARLRSELRAAEERYQALNVALSARRRDAAGKSALSFPAKLGDLARALPEDTAILEYVNLAGFQAVERVKLDRTVLFVVTRSGERVSASACPIRLRKEELKRLCTEFHDACADPRKQYQPLARKMYGLLIAPAANRLQGKSRIVVCPDGPLLDIPFHALFDGHRYLSDRYTLSYSFSASGLLAQNKYASNRRKPEKDTVIAFANPAFGDQGRFGDDPAIPGQRPLDTASRPLDSASRPLDAASRTVTAALCSEYVPRGGAIRPLPGTQREADMLGRLFPDSRVYSGVGAQEGTAKAEIGKYRYLHFATHGFVNDGAPMLSSLVLAKPVDDNEDGFLTGREILDLNLCADLAVLSACNTARGEFKEGEGILGLSWALTVAGCPTQVVSQWAVDDASTAMLMGRFYENLVKRKMGKAAALRKAQGWLRSQSPKYHHPYYWAPFVLNGAWK